MSTLPDLLQELDKARIGARTAIVARIVVLITGYPIWEPIKDEERAAHALECLVQHNAYFVHKALIAVENVAEEERCDYLRNAAARLRFVISCAP